MTRLSHAEMSDIMLGAARSLQQFITLHRDKKDRPDSWHVQQMRSVRAFQQAHEDYAAAAARKEAS